MMEASPLFWEIGDGGGNSVPLKRNIGWDFSLFEHSNIYCTKAAHPISQQTS